MVVLEKILEELSNENSKGVSHEVKDLREALGKTQLKNLKSGDLLVQVPGIDGEYTYKGDGRPHIFDRYLTEQEKIALMATGDPGIGRHDFDILVVDTVVGSLPIRHPVDSRAFRKIDE